MKAMSARCSTRSTSWKSAWRKTAICWASRLTEADWRLFTTLIRFDPVYVGHFKCNIRRIADYPNLYGYLRDLYQMPGIAETVDFHHIKTPLLRQPQDDQSDRHRARGAAYRILIAPHGRRGFKPHHNLLDFHPRQQSPSGAGVVACVVPSGSASSAKKPLSAISLSGVLRRLLAHIAADIEEHMVAVGDAGR